MIDGFDNESFSLVRGLKNAYDLSLKNCLRAFEICNKLSPKTEFLVTAIDIPKLKHQIDRIEKFWKDNYGIILYRKPYSTWNSVNNTIVNLGNNMEIIREKVCFVPWKLMSITWDGLVVPCCMDYDNIYVLGDLKHQTLAEIWNSEAFQTFRAEMRTGRIRNALCWKCQRIEHISPYE